MKTHTLWAWVLLALGFSLNEQGQAAGLVWHSSRAEAVTAARNSAKLILLLAGRDTCSNCTYMKTTVFESPAVRALIDGNYVCWYCPIDDSSEWEAYRGGLGGFTLPLICVIDPGDALNYLDRSTSIQSISVFQARLLGHLPTSEIRASPIIESGARRLLWPGESTFRYRVLESADFAAWRFVGALVRGDGSPIEFTGVSADTPRFYRIMGFK
ncbi:MAG TPA: thioredoxin family protein [Verrucomicrobiota bacterium]|mgnify:CR=1 FL=1|nr:thioredoxin family protein [Verrucomicrobiota bacterium]